MGMAERGRGYRHGNQTWQHKIHVQRLLLICSASNARRHSGTCCTMAERQAVPFGHVPRSHSLLQKPYQQCGREKTDHERGSLTCATELITTTTTHVCTARPHSDQRMRHACCKTRRMTRVPSRSQPRGYRHAMQRAPRRSVAESGGAASERYHEEDERDNRHDDDLPSVEAEHDAAGRPDELRQTAAAWQPAWQTSDAREPLRRYGMRRRCGRVFPASSE